MRGEHQVFFLGAFPVDRAGECECPGCYALASTCVAAIRLRRNADHTAREILFFLCAEHSRIAVSFLVDRGPSVRPKKRWTARA